MNNDSSIAPIVRMTTTDMNISMVNLQSIHKSGGEILRMVFIDLRMEEGLLYFVDIWKRRTAPNFVNESF